MNNFCKSSYNTVKSVKKTNAEHKVSYEQKECNVLPLFRDQFKHLNNELSLKSNDFLTCRWNSFLDNVPENYIRIRLYADFKNLIETRLVRRKTLNGEFYGIDNKLAPIPRLSSPSNLIKNKR